jgi:hypothetical protein
MSVAKGQSWDVVNNTFLDRVIFILNRGILLTSDQTSQFSFRLDLLVNKL